MNIQNDSFSVRYVNVLIIWYIMYRATTILYQIGVLFIDILKSFFFNIFILVDILYLCVKCFQVICNICFMVKKKNSLPVIQLFSSYERSYEFTCITVAIYRW